MEDAGRWLLFSLAAVPACTSTSGGSNVEVTFEDACVRYFDKVNACYGEQYGAEPPDYDYSQACAEELVYYEEQGEPCVDAATARFACVSNLDCQSFPDFDQHVVECRSAFQKAHDLCPERFGFCFGLVTVTAGGTTCGENRTGCLDGHEYAIECADMEGSVQCTCLFNGGEVSQFEAEDRSCGSGLASDVGDRCGFPDGVF